MTLRQYLIIMFLGTLLCWAAWGLVIVNVDPFTAELSGLAFFYTSLFLAFFGTVALFIFFFYSIFRKADVPLYRYVQKSFLFALYSSVFLILLAYLQSQRYLAVWNLTILGGLLLFLGLFRWSTKRAHRSRQAAQE